VKDLAAITDAEVLALCDRFEAELIARYKAMKPAGDLLPIGDRLHEECVRRRITRT
jgi:hypothetical protein